MKIQLIVVVCFLVLTTGSDGDTILPSNQAVHIGTYNATMSCASSSGFRAITWGFLPVGSSSSSHVFISFGSSGVETAQQEFYAVEQSSGSEQSNLIILNATTPRAGSYICYDNRSTLRANAKLIVIDSDPVCSMTPNAPTELLYNDTVQMSCRITYTANQYIGVDMIWSRDNSTTVVTGAILNTNTSDNLATATSTITQIPGYSSTFPIYRCNTTFKITRHFDESATNAPDYSKSTPLINTPINVIYLRPANASSITGAKDGEQVHLGTILSCTVEGNPPPRYSWLDVTYGNTTNKQTIQTWHDGQFRCIASNRAGSTSVSLNVTTYVTTSISTSTIPTTTATSRSTSSSGSAFPISVDPLFGPIAGGTNITIIGSTEIGYFAEYVGTNITGVRNVYIGKDVSSIYVSLLPTDSLTFKIVAVTPRTTETSIRQPLPIIIEFSPTSFNMSFNKFFVYLPNPEITGIFPNSFIATGGTLIDVFGKSFSSVAKPIIQLTVVITRADHNSSTSNTSTRICTVPKDNDTYMQCPMPPLSLPDDFLEILNLRYNTNVTRNRRSSDSRNQFSSNYHSLFSRMKRDVNVLTLTGPNGIDLAEIYLGFILDGYKKYENINDALPDTKLIFYSAPEINSTDELIEFDPSEEELIYLKGRHMSRGCRLIDYVVHIGNQICSNSDLQDNQLSCRPPKVEPSPKINDTIFNCQHLSILVTIGYKQYQYACLKYADHSWRLALIIGLTVGLGVFAILLAILITACIVRRRNRKIREETHRFQHSRGVALRNNRHNLNAERPGSRQDLNIIHKRQNPMTLHKPDDDYATSFQQESQQDYDHQIQ